MACWKEAIIFIIYYNFSQSFLGFFFSSAHPKQTTSFSFVSSVLSINAIKKTSERNYNFSQKKKINKILSNVLKSPSKLCREPNNYGVLIPGWAENVSHAPRAGVGPQVGVPLCVGVGHSDPELCPIIHLHLPVMSASDRDQISENGHASADTQSQKCSHAHRRQSWDTHSFYRRSHSQETPPGEGVVVRGHGTDGQLLVSIEYGEAVLGDGEAGVGRVLQEMEEGPCRGWGWTTASTFCFVLNMKNNTKRRKGQMWKNILYTDEFFFILVFKFFKNRQIYRCT